MYLNTTQTHCNGHSKLLLHNSDGHNTRSTRCSEANVATLREDSVDQISSQKRGRHYQPKGVRASARQEGHVLSNGDSKPREGDIKCTLQVEAVVRDGAVSRGGQGQGLGLEIVE